jgi:hypothetical protein
MPRPPAIDPNRLEALLKSRAPVGIGELEGILRVNRTTVLRALDGFGHRIFRTGASRNTRYALRKEIPHAGNEWDLWRIGEDGQPREWSRLAAFHDRMWRVEWASKPPAWARHFLTHDGYWDGFPFFLSDTRPQGFIGRALARALSPVLGTPDDPRLWSDDDTVSFMAHAGADGSLDLGRRVPGWVAE